MPVPRTDRKELLQSLQLTEQEKSMLQAPERARVREGAARGTLPGTPENTLRLMAAVALAAPEPELRDLAVQTSTSLADEMLSAVVENCTLEAVLWFVYRANTSRSVREKIYLNRQVPISLLVDAAKQENNEGLLELLVGNQQKMLENPEFPGTLLENPHLNTSARAKVEEFFTRTFTTQFLNHHGFTDSTDDEQPVDNMADVKLHADALRMDELPPELLEHKDGEEEEEEEIHKSLYQRVGSMSVAEKIKLALLGNMEARKLLIKESNRLVKEAVLKNPMITDSEISALAGNKATSEDMLRFIAGKRTWLRNYNVKLLLINNAKTPVAISIQMMSQLRDADIAKLVKSRNIPQVVAQQAKRLMMKKK